MSTEIGRLNPAPDAGPYGAQDHILATGRHQFTTGRLADFVTQPATASTWYDTKYGCLTWDPTAVARRHLFPDAGIPRRTLDPGADVRVCGLQYANAWPAEWRGSGDVVDTEAAHPQFAFTPGGPATPYQIDVESELRRLDQPLTRCQPVIPMDAPLFRNTVAPPTPVNVDPRAQAAANPVAVIVGPGGEGCRQAADQVASAMSGRWIGNPTRQDTMRMDLPFGPPGVGTGAARGPRAPVAGEPYFTNSPQRLAAPAAAPAPPFARRLS